MKAIIFGCGYLGTEVAKLLLAREVQVSVFRRSKAALEELQKLGCHSIQGDIAEPSSFSTLAETFDYVINVAAAGGGDGDAYRKVYGEGNCNILDWLEKTSCQKYVYTSSTSVYAQNDGSVVDESSVTEADTETGRNLRIAEAMVADSAPGIPAVVLRLCGIYGPGRGYYLKKFLAGEPLSAMDAGRYANMIHVEDAAAAIVQALKLGKPGEIYNICDNEPTQLGEMFTWFAQASKRNLPQVDASIPSAPRKRGTSNKIVSNRKARAELQWELKYPSYREGFKQELEKLKASQPAL